MSRVLGWDLEPVVEVFATAESHYAIHIYDPGLYNTGNTTSQYIPLGQCTLKEARDAADTYRELLNQTETN